MSAAIRRAVWKARTRLVGSGIARNVLATNHPWHGLLLYQVKTFRVPHAPVTHQNIGQARELARTLADFGYNLDVVDHDERRRSLLERDYDLVIDLNPVSEEPLYRDRLKSDALRIGYITGSNPRFSNAAELARLDDLERRRGIRLAPRRQTPPFPKQVFESFDALLLFGGGHTIGTYREYRLPPLHSLVNNGYDDVDPTDPVRRDPRRFLFLASNGQVHKGLDLLLEVFAAEPDLELIVCSQFHNEPDFVRAFRRELFRMPNIHAPGFVNVRSAGFRDLQAGCGAMILPSCSEGQSGTVTVAMSFGLPPLVSRECGFDEPNLETLPDCAIETVREVVRDYSRRGRPWLEERSRVTLDLMRSKYRPAHYAGALRAALGTTLGRTAGGVPGAGGVTQ